VYSGANAAQRAAVVVDKPLWSKMNGATATIINKLEQTLKMHPDAKAVAFCHAENV